MIGQTLAHYGFEDLLGEGGSGVVYRGRDLRLERPVAIKVLTDALRDDELAWARLLREARLASQLNHPHIAAIYDLGEEDGHAYIVMEYVEGLPLSDLIPEGGMPLEQVQRYAAQISGALAFAHERGTLHGDLKGSNIIVTPEGNIKLLDFGLGRRIPRNGTVEVSSSNVPLAQVGATAGTLPYLAPEVLRGDETSVQSDVWSLGVLLYQMATGELPFRGATTFEVSMEIMMGTPGFGQLPEPLQATLRRSLEKDPSHRFPQVCELALALQACAPEAVPSAAGLPALNTAIPAPAGGVPAPLTFSRYRRLWWAAGATLVLGAVVFGASLLGGLHARSVPVSPQTAPGIPAASAPQVPKPAARENPAARVWVNTDSGTYHCPGTRWYGKTHEGEYMEQKKAREKGYHPSANHACF
jgi:predicted Ser/Thr protein kinase